MMSVPGLPRKRPMPPRMPVVRGALLACFVLAGALSHAATLSVQVVDNGGQPLADAAVFAEPVGGAAAPRAARTAEIEQRGRKFLPLVTVVQVGTSISFPNNDTVRHHVYSLSQPKVFDLKLYAGEPPNPVVFDKPGTVAIGCNIHDQMAAFIEVVPTPYFAKTDAAGLARIDGIAPGKYTLKAWHYRLPPGAPNAEQALDFNGAGTPVTITMNTKPR